jgi:hypothetical protein
MIWSQSRLTDLTTHHRLAHTCEVGVEPPVEADLQFHSGLFHRRQRPIDLGEAMRDRLLAEDVLARLCRPDDEVRMGSPVEEQIRTASISEFASTLFAGVVSPWEIPQRAANACAASRLTSAIASVRTSGRSERQRFGMDLPDSAGADDSDIQLFCAQCVLVWK